MRSYHVTSPPEKTMDTAKASGSDSVFNGIQDAGREINAVERSDDVLAAGETSIAEIERLIDQLQAARDFLRAEADRVRQMNARYSHLTRTASASVGILAERLGKWQNAEMDAVA